ncbi:protein enabled-like [Penaeus indicus]|uniref:protein enabled-like n=1 Tax=Penaeus indicus TaxID=29960 RepID=UPI00300DBBC4
MGSTNKMFYLGEGPENGSASPEQAGPSTPSYEEPPPSYAQSQAGSSLPHAAPKYPQALPGHVQPLTPPQAPLQTVSGQVPVPRGHSIYRAMGPTPSVSGLAGADYPRQPPVPSLVGSASYPGQFTSLQNGAPGSSGPPPPPPGLPAETNTKKRSTCIKVSGGLGFAILVIWMIFRVFLRVSIVDT